MGRMSRRPIGQADTIAIFLIFHCAYLVVLYPRPARSISYSSPLEKYVKQGDINLGAFLSITNYSPHELCGEVLRFPLAQQYVEALIFAVDEINRDPKLMPNITLGMILLDDCVKESTASAQAVRFLSQYHVLGHLQQPQRGEGSGQPVNMVEGKSSSNASIVKAGTCDCERHTAFYDVVGVISPTRSDNCIAVSYLLSPVQVPQLSFAATSDELSDSHLHPYFLRLVPTASVEVAAILEFVKLQGWSYISIVTSRGSYGEAAATAVLTQASGAGACVAVHLRTYLGMTAPEYRDLVRKLLGFPRARAVIAFIGGVEIVGLLTAIQDLGAVGWHVWIGSDTWADHLTMVPPETRIALYGSFITKFYLPDVPKFEQHFRTIKPSSSENPWFRRFWEHQFNCSFLDRTCDESRDITESRDFHFLSLIGLAIDSVYAYAHALTDLRERECPQESGPAFRDCVSGSRLLAYLKNVSFDGTTGYVKMSETRTDYVIEQILPGKPFTFAPVARVHVDVNNDTISTSIGSGANTSDDDNQSDASVEPIRWARWFERRAPQTFLRKETIESEYDKGFVIDSSAAGSREPLRSELSASESDKTGNQQKEIFPNLKQPIGQFPADLGYRPESSCSRECKPREINVPEKTPCCWKCHLCRDNEMVAENGTKCIECPLFFWPDETLNFRNCTPIPPEYPHLDDVAVIFEVATSCLGIAISLIVCAAFIYLRESKVIKASGRELSCIQLFAIVVGYATMLVYASPPSNVLCSVAYFLFCLTLDLHYAALLVKAVRIYRIFHAAAKGNRGLRMTSPASQVILVCCIVMGQAVISTCVTGLNKATASLSQPARSERYVELSCNMSLPAVTTFLTYNLTLVLLCSVLAFKTRRLPDNYNESRFISMCVTTTLVIWLAFIPTFLTSSRASLKTLLLSLALLLNHSVALVFLFLSKLYTAIFRQDAVVVLPVVAESGQVVGMVEGVTNSGHGFSGVTKVKGRSGIKFVSGSTRVRESETQVSAIPASGAGGSGVTNVHTIFSGSLDSNSRKPQAGQRNSPPRVRKTGRFTVVTHSGNFTQEAWNRCV
ncbi:metabotropic glutamate receptor-like [Plakobranchus ocellatus]|uniref:Metabotropic glutamate receptor-like n=1 Tax=Plakobranchus ocellatus TaxID=259542 RepID=A0AAV4BU16_9GAST|nr:metabotropic glutamate receptor-like [Plakobranchus ocellatus]